MYANGQRRLRIGIFHGSGISSGTIIDTSSGRLPPQYVENLRNLINSAKQKGFVEIIVALHTIGKYDPSQWSPTKRFDSDVQAALNENWGVVTSIMPALRSTGILFRVDLGNELYLPGRIGNQFNGRTIYLQSMWGRFRSNYHHHESVGFSVRPSESRMLRHARWIYGNHPPYVIDIHAYENAFNVIRAADKGLNEAGFRVAGLIIGEAFYNDSEQASQIRAAINRSSRAVHWVAQWQLTRTSSCPQVNVAPPLYFDNYIRYGF